MMSDIPKNPISFFFKGIRLKDRRLSHNPIIWTRYICWCIQFWMNSISWIYPLFFRIFVRERLNKDICYLPGHRAWKKTARWFRNIAGFSHRCEFTDPKEGALYGGTSGAFMDRHFDKFLENIS